MRFDSESHDIVQVLRQQQRPAPVVEVAEQHMDAALSEIPKHAILELNLVPQTNLLNVCFKTRRPYSDSEERLSG